MHRHRCDNYTPALPVRTVKAFVCMFHILCEPTAIPFMYGIPKYVGLLYMYTVKCLKYNVISQREI